MDKKTADENLGDRGSKDQPQLGAEAVLVGVPGKLTANQQQLLMKFYDRECSFFDWARVKLLLSVNHDARLYLAAQSLVADRSSDAIQGLSSFGAAIRAYEQRNRTIPGGSLWPTVSLGISQEKRLRSVSLGAIPRDDISEPSANWAGRLGWGLSGASVAAGVIYIAINIFNVRVGSVGEYNPREQGVFGGAREVAVSQGLGGRDRVVGQGYAASMNERRLVVMEGANEGLPVRLIRAPRVKAPRSSAQVEWVRSNGKPTFIKDPRQGAPIIWIRRIPKVMIPSGVKASETWNRSAVGKQVSEPYADFE